MVETYTTRGYGGRISLLTAFNAGDSITAIIVIDNKETPGLGTRIVEKTFLEQFMNISFDSIPGNKFSVKKDGGSIDALTGATISSRALCDALNRAKNIKDGSSGPQVFIETKDSCCIKEISILKEVMPAFDNDPLTGSISCNGLQIFIGMKGPLPCGYAVKTFAEGYDGNIWLLVGFTADGSICKINVLRQTETNGRGSKITEADFLEQFYGLHPGKNNIKVSDEGGEIDAITASTISSAAFCKAIDNAWKALKKGGLK
jgi:electron transport complex protein RnfG